MTKLGRAVVLGWLACALPACGPTVPPSVAHPLGGRAAPPISVRALNGLSVEVPGGFRTRATVVDFWASWCGSCPSSMRALEQLWKRYRGEGLRVVGISADEDASSARAAATSIGVTFPIVLDDFQRVLSRYRVARIPLTFVLDAAGTVRWVGRDVVALDQAVRAVLAEPSAERDVW